MALKDRIARRQQLVKESRDILDLADKRADKKLTAEEEQRYSKLQDDIQDEGKAIEREQRQLEAEKAVASDAILSGNVEEGRAQSQELTEEEMRVIAERFRAGSRVERSRNPFELERSARSDPNEEKRRAAFAKVIRSNSGPDYLHNLQEHRALLVNADTSGGFLVPPQEFVSQVIKFVDDQVFIRPKATKMTLLKAESLGIPSLVADPADSDWTTEIGTYNPDSQMSFGKRELFPHPLTKEVDVSKTLLRLSPIDIQAYVQWRLGYKFGISEEKAFLLGNGAQQPLGLFVASSNGIDTSRDVNTGNTTTAVTFDGLIEAKYSVKGNYWAKAEWIFHRLVLKTISKLKDGEGQYLWQPSKQVGDPDRLLGNPVNMSEYAPSTMTTGLYVGIFGDFSFYWIVDTLNLEFQMLYELLARTNQVGIIARQEVDGMPVLAEPFARVKLS